MCERLREVSKCFAARTCLFRVKPQVIGIGQHLLEQQPGFFEPAPIPLPRASQGLHEPEGADVEGALFTGQSISAAPDVISVDQTARYQAALSR